MGTFAFHVANPAKVLAVEAARDAHLACKAAANIRGVPVLALHRDLFRNPLQPEEAGRFGAILLDPPRAGSKSGVLSPHSDADQHQAVSDLTVFSGGMGQVVVDGEIENRVYGSKAGPDGKLIVMPAEFNGQPILGGHTYDVKAGDWVMIPPDVPHMYLAEPNEGLMYINMKIYLGFTHPGMEYATYSEN